LGRIISVAFDTSIFLPQEGQNLAVSRTSFWQCGHFMDFSLSGATHFRKWVAP